MGKGDTSINYPAQPTYGESMREGLEAQVALLTGTKVGDDADFSQFPGGLQKLVQDYEAPLRQTTAQIDTDVLRQTLLGDVTEAQETEVTYDDSGRIIRGYKEAPSYEVRQTFTGGVRNDSGNLIKNEVGSIDAKNFFSNRYGSSEELASTIRLELVSPEGEVLAFSTEKMDFEGSYPNVKTKPEETYENAVAELFENMEAADDIPDDVISTFKNNYKTAGSLSGETGTGNQNRFKNPSISVGEGAPIYATDSEGKIIQDESKAGTTETRVLPAQRAEDGMIDLLGDKQLTADGRKPGFDAQGNFLGLSALAEDIQRGNLSRQRERDLADVERLSGRFQDVMEDYRPGTAEAVTGARDVLESQRQNLTGQRPATAADVAAGDATEVGEMISTGRGLITVPTTDTFGGLVLPATLTAATLGEGPTLDAQTSFTAAKLGTTPTLDADTGFTAATVGDAPTLTADTSFDPASAGTAPTLDAKTTFDAATVGSAPTLTAETIYDPLTALARQKLTADTSFIPSADVTGGTFDANTKFDAAEVADPLKLEALTSFDPSASLTGTSYTAAGAANPMTLSAETSFTPSAGVTGEGFTGIAELEGGAISADPLRQALMADAEAALGQGLTAREERQIAEAARARATMMGRTFDQSEAIREAEARVLEDNARRMQNRAFAQGVLGQEAGLQESDLSRGLQAAAQNQAALNRAAEFGAGQAMQAQLANQAATNEALRLGMAAGLSQEALAAQQQQAQAFANQQAQNRALEFGASTQMDAQRLNQAAINQALSQGLQAGLSQEALAAQQAQAKALADATNLQEARASEIQAGLQQEARANQASLQAQLANQQAINRAREFAAQAGISQEEAEARLGQQAGLTEFGAEQRRQELALEAGLAQEQAQAQFDERRALSQADLTQQARMAGLQAGLAQEQAQAGFDERRALTQAELNQQAAREAVQTALAREQAQAGITQRGQLAQADLTQQARQAALQAGLQQDQAQAALTQQAQRDQANLAQQAALAGLQAGMQQDAQQAEIDQQRDILQAQLNQQGAAFDAEALQQAKLATQRQLQQAQQFGVGAQMDAERLNAQLAQQGALGYVDAATRLAALEDQTTLDPFAALLNRAGGGSLGQAGQVFGQANYGLSSGPQYLNPESGLGFISQMAANEASMYGAQQAANASRSAGLSRGLGSLFGGAVGGLLGNPKLF